MQVVTTLSLRSRGQWALALMAAATGLVACLAFQGYLKLVSLPVVLGLAALPLTFRPQQERGFGRLPLLLTLLFCTLTLLAPVRTLLFLGFGGLLACGAGLLGQRGRLLSFWTWILLSPLFAHMANIFSLPLRLQLAAGCGKLLSVLSVPIAIRGNVLEDSHGRFSIDPGCMGLNMLVASLLLGVLLVGYYERKLGRRLGVPALLGYVLLLMLLNVGSNMIRILLLVWFVWLPGTLMHELAGLLCLAIYVGLPALALARRLVRRAPELRESSVRFTGNRARTLFALLCGLFIVSSARVLGSAWEAEAPLPPVRIGAYQASTFGPGILKLSDGAHLVYVKFVRGAFDLEHNPTICWSGNGYSFSEVAEADLGGTRIYTAQLVQGKERLYTAWWYSNGQEHTCRQLEWRRRMLLGAPRFAVVNVTAASAAARDAEVLRILKGNLLAPVFSTH